MEWKEVVPGMWRTHYPTSTKLASNAVLVALDGGDLAVVSPPQNASDEFYAATDKLGKVTALVAPNLGHDLGQAAWQERYASATVHAPDVTAKAIAKAKPKLRAFASMGALAERTGSKVRFVDLPGTSSGSVALSVEAAGKRVLVIDDCLSNSPSLVGPAPVRFVFWATGSGPGLAKNKLWWWVFCKDKPAYTRALLEEWDRASTDVVLPLHGDEISGDDVGRARAFVSGA